MTFKWSSSGGARWLEITRALPTILGSFGFVALGVALLKYTDAPVVVGWATIGFFGPGGIWLVAKLIHKVATFDPRSKRVNLDLPLTELSRTAAGEYHATALGTIDGRRVGFSIVLGAMWHAHPSTGFTLYSGTVVLRAIGDSSDAFVDCLAARYGVSLATRRMLPDIAVRTVGLASDPREIELRPVTMKLFFHPEVPDRYAELYLQIDRAEQRVQLAEKDWGYRDNVLRALTEVGPDPVTADGEG